MTCAACGKEGVPTKDTVTIQLRHLDEPGKRTNNMKVCNFTCLINLVEVIKEEDAISLPPDGAQSNRMADDVKHPDTFTVETTQEPKR